MYHSFVKIQGDCPKSNYYWVVVSYTSYTRQQLYNSGLQILYCCLVFEKFTSEKLASKCHAVIFILKNTKCEVFQVANTKIWSQLFQKVFWSTVESF